MYARFAHQCSSFQSSHFVQLLHFKVRFRTSHFKVTCSETEVSEQVYCTAGRKQKTKIIDEFTANTGYNRKYAIHLLKNTACIKVTHFNNAAKQSVQVITKTRKKRRYNFGCSQCAASLTVKFSTENLTVICHFSFHSCGGFNTPTFSVRVC